MAIMTASNHTPTMSEDNTSVSLIGNPCGHHGQYTFYKAFEYKRAVDEKRILMLGEFFFLRISPHDDPCIGELQLLWEDRQRNQLLSSTRLYFLPEQTPDGRQPHHGEHEVLAASEKVVLRLTDLVSWITHQVDWLTGLHYHWQSGDNVSSADAAPSKQPLTSRAFMHNQNVMAPNRGTFLTSQHLIHRNRCKIILNSNSNTENLPNITPYGLDFNDVIGEKLKINQLQNDLSAVVILSYDRYCRYRSLLKRAGPPKADRLLSRPSVQDVLVELGIPLERNNRVNILFCRDSFEHEALVNNDLNCDHLAPRLKGRPRKRPIKPKTRASSPESIHSISSEENSSAVQPRRSRRAVSSLVSGVINYSEPKKSSRRSKSKKKAAASNGVAKKALTNRKSSKVVKSETNASGNETDSNSSVDANNNVTAADLSVSPTANQELKEQVKNETVFLDELHKFMTQRKTPITKIPNLGFKKIDLFVFYMHAQKFGGYDILTKERLWKRLYDLMGGDRRSTSAATCTRRHYERLLLPFERFLNGLPDTLTSKKSRNIASTSHSSNSSKEDDAEDNNEDDMEDEINISSNDKDKATTLAISEDDNSPIKTEHTDISSNDSDQIINFSHDQERLILKFSRTNTANRKSHKPKLTNLINSLVSCKSEETNLNKLSPETEETLITKNDLHKFNNQSDGVEIFNSEFKNEPSISPPPVVLKESSNEATSCIKSDGASGSSMSSQGTSRKITALVHPRQRKPNQMDIYDFKDQLTDPKAENNDIFLFKSSDNEVNKRFSSPIGSISTLISQMPDTIQQKRLHNKQLDSQILNDSVIKEVVMEESAQKLFVRKAFSLPKPYDSPIDILLTLKQSDNSNSTEELLEPRPAHSAGTCSNAFDKLKTQNLPESTKSRADILDLSIKKRCLEAESTTPVENILDLTTKRPKSTKSLSSKNCEMLSERGTTLSTAALPSKRSSPGLNFIPNVDPHRQTKIKNIDLRRSWLPEVKRESPVEKGISSSVNRNDSAKIYHNHTSKSRSHTSSDVESNASDPSQVTHFPSQLGPLSAFGGERPVPAQQPSISEYNPLLPTFVQPPPLWPNWNSNFPLSPFSLPPPAPNTAPNMQQLFNPSHLFLPGAFSNETLANSFFGPTIFDQSKQLMEAYASPLLLKSIIEQNQMFANTNARNAAFLQHLFTSTK